MKTAVWVAGILIVACSGLIWEAWKGRRKRREATAVQRLAAMHRSPAVTAVMRGPVPADGRPLDHDEARRLGRIEMDSMIEIAEPRYDSRRAR